MSTKSETKIISEHIKTHTNILRQTLLLLILSLISFTKTEAQNKKEFKNQGEQEDFWAVKLLQNEYIKQDYKPFNGKIKQIDNNTLKFDSINLEIVYLTNELRPLFTTGILYPSLLRENDSSNLRITDFHELEFLRVDFTRRRFKFWLFSGFMVNPQVYFLELTNSSATKATDIVTFLKGSKLTFLKYGWTII